MNEHHLRFKHFIDWVAAVLGVGTFAGVVNVGVGLLSGIWIAYQLWAFITIDVPLKREKLARLRAGRDDTERGDL